LGGTHRVGSFGLGQKASAQIHADTAAYDFADMDAMPVFNANDFGMHRSRQVAQDDEH
jgi:hypothetical protein